MLTFKSIIFSSLGGSHKFEADLFLRLPILTLRSSIALPLNLQGVTSADSVDGDSLFGLISSAFNARRLAFLKAFSILAWILSFKGSRGTDGDVRD
jgi:hypothetical protein